MLLCTGALGPGLASRLCYYLFRHFNGPFVSVFIHNLFLVYFAITSARRCDNVILRLYARTLWVLVGNLFHDSLVYVHSRLQLVLIQVHRWRVGLRWDLQGLIWECLIRNLRFPSKLERRVELWLRRSYRIIVTMVVRTQNVGVRADRVFLVLQMVQIQDHWDYTLRSWWRHHIKCWIWSRVISERAI